MEQEEIKDFQFFAQGNTKGLVLPNSDKQSISVVIAKPTRVCNADCSYCSSPPLEEMGEGWEPEWSFDLFKVYFDKVFPHMINGGFWIWHGGEPMLMQVDFYKKSFEYAQQKMKEHNKVIYFSMQSNLLGYNQKWKSVFIDIFGGSLSTSFDPDEMNRTIKGNSQTYSKVFKRVLNELLDDGFRPMVIGVYKEETAHLMHKMYDWSASMGDKAFPLRFNYCHPTGRIENGGEAIKPQTYGKYLIEIYDRWIKDNPDFTVTPLDQMFKKTIGIDGEGHCPWTKSCGGKFISIEPNGDVYNCADFADLGEKYRFGNLRSEQLLTMLKTKPAIQIRRRSVQLPNSCMSCEHFSDCEGGCARDSTLYNHGLYGKFHYCQSWKMVFARIKESILLGQADGVILRYGKDPEEVRSYLRSNINNHYSQFSVDWETIESEGFASTWGAGGNLLDTADTYDEIGEFIPTKQSEYKYKDEALKNELPINQKLSKIMIKLE